MIIDYETIETWKEVVDNSIDNLPEVVNKLKEANLEYVCWDCSNLDDVIGAYELQSILQNIQEGISQYSIRMYHGCRLNEGENPLIDGLTVSSTQGIKDSLMDLVDKDDVLKPYSEEILDVMKSPFYIEQEKCRNNQIWFCLTMNEMINDGGVYVAFGSEFRLLILNAINEGLKERIFLYGKPSVVVAHVPIAPILSSFVDVIAKFLFSLWVHETLNLNDVDKPDGYACYVKENIPAEYIVEIIHPERVYDQYNSDSRWYKWDEIFKGS